VWFVAVASDDIKQISIEQLDEAFRLGIISAETAVWTEGMEAWAPLGEVADLSDDDGSSESDGHDARSEMGSGVVNTPAAFNGGSAFSQDATLPGAGMSHASFSAGPSSVAPVTASFAPSSPFVQSTVPVALNVDEDMPPVRVGRRFKPERWLLAAAAVAGVGVTAYNNSDLFASTPAPVAAAAAAPALDSKPATRGYDVGNDVSDGVEKGASLPSASAKEEAKASAPVADAPIGGASLAAKGTAQEDEEAEAVAAPDKQSLKGSFTKAFNKKAPVAKASKASRATRASKAPKARKTAAARPAPKAKKSSAPKAGSAFDPLNDSLP
jgi:hypothetical protein